MYNNASYRQFNVTGGPTNFTFSGVGSTVRMQPAIMAWTGATVNQVEPDPGNDGLWFMGYKVTNPSPGVYHYEYALYNENLDRASNLSVCLWALEPTSVTSDFMRHLKNPAGQTTARLTTRVTAANRGLSLRPAILSLGTAKPLRRIRTPTRFAGAHCIISGSTPINRRRLPMRQLATLRQARP